ncbi:hypothetical protein [Brevibacillus fulvus]|uniref:DUF3106 domain-containing protein n=1 Tax=Brevibacillus fulvus TaxID=1125967 RepID=A0A938Y2B2_9BACL|nr:hypothetical protein [Brevibacillus fulvus]MBM7592010.1 hypothetical protein [Brevibacillus fulvus]
MIRRKAKFLLTASLLVSLALPVAAYAETVPGMEGNQHTGHGQRAAVHHREHFRSSFHLGPHRQLYLQLLAEKYAPDSVESWKAAFAEQERLMQEIRTRREQMKKDPAYQKLREQYKQLSEDLHKKAESGAISREEMREQLHAWKEKNLPQDYKRMRKEWKAVREKYRPVHEQFDQAVAARDEAAIKAVLPKLLEELNEGNKQLAQTLGQPKSK